MWIATKLGFYSIVKKEDAYHIRARVKSDLERLLDAANDKLSNDYPVEEWPEADYQYRFRVNSHADYAYLFHVLSESIDYDNFKNTIAKTEHQAEKGAAYSHLWGDLFRIQSEHRYGSWPESSDHDNWPNRDYDPSQHAPVRYF